MAAHQSNTRLHSNCQPNCPGYLCLPKQTLESPVKFVLVLGEQSRPHPEREEGFPALRWLTQHFSDVTEAKTWISDQETLWSPAYKAAHLKAWKCAVYLDLRDKKEPSVSVLSWAS